MNYSQTGIMTTDVYDCGGGPFAGSFHGRRESGARPEQDQETRRHSAFKTRAQNHALYWRVFRALNATTRYTKYCPNRGSSTHR